MEYEGFEPPETISSFMYDSQLPRLRRIFRSSALFPAMKACSPQAAHTVKANESSSRTAK